MAPLEDKINKLLKVLHAAGLIVAQHTDLHCFINFLNLQAVKFCKHAVVSTLLCFAS